MTDEWSEFNRCFAVFQMRLERRRYSEFIH
jgi:hypothetical protein